MILREQERYATRNFLYSTKLFEQHRSERVELQSLDKIRTQRMTWRQGWLSLSQGTLLPKTSPTPSGSFLANTVQISTSPNHRTVTCQRGPVRESFSGTQYRVVNQVVLFLTTGTSGDTLREKSPGDLMKTVALSSYASALLRLRSLEKSTSPETESSKRVIHRPGGSVLVKPRLPEVEFSRKSTET